MTAAAVARGEAAFRRMLDSLAILSAREAEACTQELSVAVCAETAAQVFRSDVVPAGLSDLQIEAVFEGLVAADEPGTRRIVSAALKSWIVPESQKPAWSDGLCRISDEAVAIRSERRIASTVTLAERHPAWAEDFDEVLLSSFRLIYGNVAPSCDRMLEKAFRDRAGGRPWAEGWQRALYVRGRQYRGRRVPRPELDALIADLAPQDDLDRARFALSVHGWAGKAHLLPHDASECVSRPDRHHAEIVAARIAADPDRLAAFLAGPTATAEGVSLIFWQTLGRETPDPHGVWETLFFKAVADQDFGHLVSLHAFMAAANFPRDEIIRKLSRMAAVDRLKLRALDFAGFLIDRFEDYLDFFSHHVVDDFFDRMKFGDQAVLQSVDSDGVYRLLRVFPDTPAAAHCAVLWVARLIGEGLRLDRDALAELARLVSCDDFGRPPSYALENGAWHSVVGALLDSDHGTDVASAVLQKIGANIGLAYEEEALALVDLIAARRPLPLLHHLEPLAHRVYWKAAQSVTPTSESPPTGAALIPRHVVRDWLAEDSAPRARLVVEAVMPIRREGEAYRWEDAILEVLDLAAVDDAILTAIEDGFLPTSATDGYPPWLETRADVFEALSDHPNPAVRAWARDAGPRVRESLRRIREDFDRPYEPQSFE